MTKKHSLLLILLPGTKIIGFEKEECSCKTNILNVLSKIDFRQIPQSYERMAETIRHNSLVLTLFDYQHGTSLVYFDRLFAEPIVPEQKLRFYIVTDIENISLRHFLLGKIDFVSPSQISFIQLTPEQMPLNPLIIHMDPYGKIESLTNGYYLTRECILSHEVLPPLKDLKIIAPVK
ncbi:MAG TPA: hypothetical protein VFQ58_04070 [Flavisolibacter sp.]|jgi:hypothetical protein|nr:hypothetical protein [Flavisolibacter sp.]